MGETSAVGHSRPSREGSNSGQVRYAAEKRKQIRRQPCSLRGLQRSALSVSRIALRLGEPD
jgi:hypothetical protein